ncbi:MAG TPA: hypothetical protein VNM92_01670 [Thermoanaerobaculia bacterium]|nr:hypothetical protein [Thermoanaerobaculia bacterium]
MAALTLTHREMWQLLGISRGQFYALKGQGIFDHLESPIPFRYSRAKVERFINGRAA